MTEHHGLQWRPTEDIDLLGRQIAEMLAAITAQREALRAACQKSDNLDAYTLVRLTARLTVQRDNLWHIDEQLRHWLTAQLTVEQRLQIQRLGEQMLRLYDVIDATLHLAGEMERSSGDHSKPGDGTSRVWLLRLPVLSRSEGSLLRLRLSPDLEWMH